MTSQARARKPRPSPVPATHGPASQMRCRGACWRDWGRGEARARPATDGCSARGGLPGSGVHAARAPPRARASRPGRPLRSPISPTRFPLCARACPLPLRARATSRGPHPKPTASHQLPRIFPPPGRLYGPCPPNTPPQPTPHLSLGTACGAVIKGKFTLWAPVGPLSAWGEREACGGIYAPSVKPRPLALSPADRCPWSTLTG